MELFGKNLIYRERVSLFLDQPRAFMLNDAENGKIQPMIYPQHDLLISRIQYIHDFLDLVFSCKVTQEEIPNAELAEVLSDIVCEYDLVFEDLVYKPPKDAQ